MTWEVPVTDVTRVLGSGPQGSGTYRGITTDTRQVKGGELFVALTGDRFDGHDFISQAMARGATGVVAMEGKPVPAGIPVHRVADTRQALGALAHRRREEFEGLVVAITGTNGKTTTKELIAAALSTEFDVHSTAANENNLVGVPLKNFRAPDSATAMVVEVGANQPGEIARLRAFVSPDIAVITNVGAAHLEGFGSIEAVLKEKTSLLTDVPAAVVGDRPSQLVERARELVPEVLVAGGSDLADLRPESIEITPAGRTRFVCGGVEFEAPLPGVHAAYNALIAAGVAQYAGIELKDAARGIVGARIPGSRTRLEELGGMTVLDDSYNANPESTIAAIETAEVLAAGRRLILVLGSMLELGEQTRLLHREVAHRALESTAATVIGVGQFGVVTDIEPSSDRSRRADDARGAGELLREIARPGDFILIKGSRGVHLEDALSILKESQP